MKLSLSCMTGSIITSGCYFAKRYNQLNQRARHAIDDLEFLEEEDEKCWQNWTDKKQNCIIFI